MKKITQIIKVIMVSMLITIFCIALTLRLLSLFDKNTFYNNVVDAQTQKKSEIILPVIKEIPKTKPAPNSEYGKLKIPSIEVELPICYGTSSKVLKKGVGHDTTSYLPGEGGSIILMGHNFKQFLARLPQAKKGDKIEITTDYGVFEYEIYNAKIVNESNVEEVPIQNEQEILMIYTCWPINNVTHAYERYVVYAK